MRVEATKTMAKELNRRCNYCITWESMSPERYAVEVCSDPFWSQIMDYMSNVGAFRVLKVTYPDNCYACPNYLTTRDLTDLLHTNGCETLEELADAVNDFIAI